MNRTYRRPRAWRTLALIVLVGAATSASGEPEHGVIQSISLGQPVAGEVQPGETRRLAFEVEAGNFVYGMIDSQNAASFKGRVSNPSGEFAQAFMGGLVTFVAPSRGSYVLELTNASDKAAALNLTLNAAKPLDPNAASSQEILSPRLKKQALALTAGTADTSEFWSQITTEGTPLIEQTGDDFLVTLLWRGDASARTVKVAWSLFHVAPVIELSRLGASDIWFRSFRFPAGTRFTYRMIPDPPVIEGPPMLRAMALLAVAQADPLNHGSAQPSGHGSAQPNGHDSAQPNGRGSAQPNGADPLSSMSVLELPPGVRKSQWTTVREGVARGAVNSFELKSGITRNNRRISVYTPPGYAKECGSYDLLVLLDGTAYQSMIPVPTILDNLISAKQIDPTIAVFVDNASVEGRAADMYPNRAFTEFVTTQLMSRIRSQYAVTQDPTKVLIGGFSLGGLAATHIAWRHPEIFGAVLSQSGSFWWSESAIEAGRGEPILTEGPLLDPRIESFELVRLIANAPRSAIRLYLEAGLYEGDLLTANRFMREVLSAKGYDFRYKEFPGGHDPSFWRESFAEGLLSLAAREPSAAPAGCKARAAQASPASKRR